MNSGYLLALIWIVVIIVIILVVVMSKKKSSSIITTYPATNSTTTTQSSTTTTAASVLTPTWPSAPSTPLPAMTNYTFPVEIDYTQPWTYSAITQLLTQSTSTIVKLMVNETGTGIWGAGSFEIYISNAIVNVTTDTQVVSAPLSSALLNNIQITSSGVNSSSVTTITFIINGKSSTASLPLPASPGKETFYQYASSQVGIADQTIWPTAYPPFT